MKDLSEENTAVGVTVMFITVVGTVFALNAYADLPGPANVGIALVVGMVARFVAFLIEANVSKKK